MGYEMVLITPGKVFHSVALQESATPSVFFPEILGQS